MRWMRLGSPILVKLLMLSGRQALLRLEDADQQLVARPESHAPSGTALCGA